MKFRRLLLILLPFVVIFAACTVQPRKNTITPDTAGEANAAAVLAASASANENLKISYDCLEGENAFSALQKSGHKIEFKESSLGKLVTSIDDQAQQEQKFWQYSINDKDAAVGAESYKCQGTEKISWELK